MMKLRTLTIAAAAALLAGGMTVAGAGEKQSAQGHDRAMMEQPEFDHLDRDGNGFIGRDEAERVPALAESFEDADANDDGKLSHEEYDELTGS